MFFKKKWRTTMPQAICTKAKKSFLIKALFLMFLLFAVFSCFSACKKSPDDVSKNLTNYSISASFDDTTKTLTCNQIVDYINPYDTVLSNLEFHLYPNAFSSGVQKGPVSSLYKAKAYPNGENFGGIEIQNVQVEGKEQEVKLSQINNEVLVVDFQEELFPDERIVIELNYVVTLPNCLHRFGYGDNTYNFGNFYPVASIYENGKFHFDEYSSNGDPFYSDVANYNVTIKCDNDFIVASTGEQISSTTDETNIKTTNIVAKTVRDFAFVMSKKFEVISDKVGDTTVFYYYYNDDNAKQSLQAGVDAIKTFSNLFGKYPYSTMSVVKANFIHGGMEYPNLVYISDEIESREEYLNVIIHETAHQWWYGMVGNNQCKNAWLDEGLTEYSTLLFYKNNSGYNYDVKQSLNSSLSSYLLFSEICNSVYGSFDDKMNKNVNDYRGDMEYVYVTYVKGVLFFENLDELVGNKNFLKSLKLYFNQNCFKIATPENLISAFETTCKRSLESYFDSWINAKVVLQNYKN